MPRTWLEVPFDDRHITDLEDIAEAEGGSVEQIVQIAVAAFIKIYEKEGV